MLAEVGYYDFAPAPYVCCGICVPDALQKRTFFRAFENRVEGNLPVAPCCCLCDDEKYMVDMPWLDFYDKPPFRAGMLCICIPAICCGPPVVFAKKPKFCCIDLSELKGQQIRAAPCNMWGLKVYLCCGQPCYVFWSREVVRGVKNPHRFLSVLGTAVRQNAQMNNIPREEVAVFDAVVDNIGDTGTRGSIQTYQQPLTMSR